MQIEIPEQLVDRLSRLSKGHTVESYALKLLKKATDEAESTSVVTYAFANDKKAFISAISIDDAVALYKQLHPAYPREIVAQPATTSDIERMHALGITSSWTRAAKQFKSK